METGSKRLPTHSFNHPVGICWYLLGLSTSDCVNDAGDDSGLSCLCFGLKGAPSLLLFVRAGPSDNFSPLILCSNMELSSLVDRFSVLAGLSPGKGERMRLWSLGGEQTKDRMLIHLLQRPTPAVAAAVEHRSSNTSTRSYRPSWRLRLSTRLWDSQVPPEHSKMVLRELNSLVIHQSIG
ncbi:hypothetical protein MLD38_003619 [Melastoma candidum]|uniref:Uncharacterized protein n=1 Tax=Melastoma candidum TaxID=119954 RepID=A0ACB9S551_9MYRT|nr:hypothetical protein MLD38_003619 [Melastoma candidum]